MKMFAAEDKKTDRTYWNVNMEMDYTINANEVKGVGNPDFCQMLAALTPWHLKSKFVKGLASGYPLTGKVKSFMSGD